MQNSSFNKSNKETAGIEAYATEVKAFRFSSETIAVAAPDKNLLARFVQSLSSMEGFEFDHAKVQKVVIKKTD